MKTSDMEVTFGLFAIAKLILFQWPDRHYGYWYPVGSKNIQEQFANITFFCSPYQSGLYDSWKTEWNPTYRWARQLVCLWFMMLHLLFSGITRPPTTPTPPHHTWPRVEEGEVQSSDHQYCTLVHLFWSPVLYTCTPVLITSIHSNPVSGLHMTTTSKKCFRRWQ